MAEIQTSLLASSVRAKWCMTVLFASVAPLVQMMSAGWQPRNAASFSRASRNAAFARSPMRCGLDGLPVTVSVASSQASRQDADLPIGVTEHLRQRLAPHAALIQAEQPERPVQHAVPE